MSFLRPVLRKTLFKFNNLSISTRRYLQNSIDLDDPNLQKYLGYLLLEHENLQCKARTPEVNRRLRFIKPIVFVLEQRIALHDNIASLKNLVKSDKDEEIKKMAKEEAEIYLKSLKSVDRDLISTLLEPCLSEGGVLVEITAGAGGQEAMLFARELFEMYQSYAAYKDWQLDIASIEESDLGGVRKVSMLIGGYGAPELMKMEAGVHRVQRVPSTEKGGRIHTSTVSVAVLPQPSEVDLEIPDRDINIETKRASGAGGQHVNTTDSAVRITHLPTGTVVECQEGRSQIKNKQIAMQKLRTLLLEKQLKEQEHQINSERKSQIGSSNRNEKIRTYNFPQDRVTEHRKGGISHSLKSFMEGEEVLQKCQENLLRQQKYDELMEDLKEFTKKIEASAN